MWQRCAKTTKAVAKTRQAQRSHPAGKAEKEGSPAQTTPPGRPKKREARQRPEPQPGNQARFGLGSAMPEMRVSTLRGEEGVCREGARPKGGFFGAGAGGGAGGWAGRGTLRHDQTRDPTHDHARSRPERFGCLGPLTGQACGIIERCWFVVVGALRPLFGRDGQARGATRSRWLSLVVLLRPAPSR